MVKALNFTILKPQPAFAKKQKSGGAEEGPTQEAFLQAVQMHGSPASAWMAMNRDNFKFRQRVRDLKEEVEGLEKGQPEDGGVVLSKVDSATWEEYKALGKPGDLKKSTEELTKLRAGVVTDVTKAAASALNWNDVVLKSIVEANKLEIQFVAGKDTDGKAIQTPVVLVLGDGGVKTQHDLKEYATNNPAISPFLPALSAGAADAEKEGATGADKVASQKFTPYLPQKGATTDQQKSKEAGKLSALPAEFAARRQAAVSPFAVPVQPAAQPAATK